MTGQGVSRRRFLKIGCVTTAAAGLTVCGGSLLIPKRKLPPIKLPSESYGESASGKRVLVVYASYAGSTGEVADAVGKILGERGFRVDVRPVEEKPAVDGYQAVLLGSAVQFGKWLPGAVGFAKANQAGLNRVPVALFSVHITNLEDSPAAQAARLAYLDEVRAFVQPAEQVFLAGKFDERGAALLMPGLISRLMPVLDQRDWGKIQAWGQSVLA